jgi:DNA-binding protein H-NS
LGSLTDGPLKAKPAMVKVKYRGPNGETWSGVGAMAGWLKKLKDGGEDVERHRMPT